MANDHPGRQYGNLGLGVPYVQLYMPISSDLILCAYGRELLGRYNREHQEELEKIRAIAFERFYKGEISGDIMRESIVRTAKTDRVEHLIECVRAGNVVEQDEEGVASWNRLQALYATRLVVDSRGDWIVAKEAMVSRKKAAQREAQEREPRDDVLADKLDTAAWPEAVKCEPSNA